MKHLSRQQFSLLSRASQHAYLASRGIIPAPSPHPADTVVDVHGVDGEWSMDDMQELRESIEYLEEKIRELTLAWFEILREDQERILSLYDVA